MSAFGKINDQPFSIFPDTTSSRMVKEIRFISNPAGGGWLSRGWSAGLLTDGYGRFLIFSSTGLSTGELRGKVRSFSILMESSVSTSCCGWGHYIRYAASAKWYVLNPARRVLLPSGSEVFAVLSKMAVSGTRYKSGSTACIQRIQDFYRWRGS